MQTKILKFPFENLLGLLFRLVKFVFLVTLVRDLVHLGFLLLHRQLSLTLSVTDLL